MAYAFGIKIDNAVIPPPSGYTFHERDLVANSHRNGAGTAVWDVIRRNVGEIELEWANLDETRLKAIIIFLSKSITNIRAAN